MPFQVILRAPGLPWWLSWWRICMHCGRPGFRPWVGVLRRRERCPPQHSCLENSYTLTLGDLGLGKPPLSGLPENLEAFSILKVNFSLKKIKTCVLLTLTFITWRLIHVMSRWMSRCSVMPDSVTPWDLVRKAPLVMGFFWQEYWRRLPFPSPGDLSDPGVKPASPMSSALQAVSLPLSHLGSPMSQWDLKKN